MRKKETCTPEKRMELYEKMSHASLGAEAREIHKELKKMDSAGSHSRRDTQSFPTSHLQ